MGNTLPVQSLDPRFALQGMEEMQNRIRLQAMRKRADAASATVTDAATDPAAPSTTPSTTPSATPSAAPVDKNATPQNKQAEDKLLVEFQGIMLKEMVKAMRATVPKSSLFPESSGREMFESFLDEQYAEALTRKMGGMGLTEALQRQLNQGSGPAPDPAGKKAPRTDAAAPAKT